MDSFYKQISTLTSGTVTSNDTGQDVIIIHDAASLAATLTLVMPATPTDGQLLTFMSVLGVTALTITSTPTLVGGLASVAPAGNATWMYERSNNKWYRYK